MNAEIKYSDEESQYYHEVIYLVNDSGIKLTRSFESEFLAKQFARKLKHSKTCTLIAYPTER